VLEMMATFYKLSH